MREDAERPARSWCPECGAAVPAILREKDGDLLLRRDCSSHGSRETLFWKDARLYQPFPPAAEDLLPEGFLDVRDPRLESFVTTLAIDPTSRCNLGCPACFSQARPAGEAPAEDPPLRELLDRIPDYRGRRRRPALSLIGGEATLREDLPEFIAAVIREKGLMPRLCSNGVRLGEGDLLERLRQAGLRWIILQFDGLRAESSLALRGVDLTGKKLALIDRIAAHGMMIHLAVMVRRGTNDQELGDILRFAAANPKVHRVSFYPCSATGRGGGAPAGEVTQVADVLAAIERGTGGRIRREDILETKALAAKLFRWTGLAMFRPRPCLFPFLLLRRGGDPVSCHRFFTLRGILSEPRGFLTMLGGGFRLLRQYEGRGAADFLFVSIEKFYDDHAFLSDAARNCHHLYLTPGGVLPFCVYNTCGRRRGEGRT